jgi:hypothetical protein
MSNSNSNSNKRYTEEFKKEIAAITDKLFLDEIDNKQYAVEI